jgi:hypothetical protein
LWKLGRIKTFEEGVNQAANMEIMRLSEMCRSLWLLGRIKTIH